MIVKWLPLANSLQLGKKRERELEMGTGAGAGAGTVECVAIN